jgi:hypothetical protein
MAMVCECRKPGQQLAADREPSIPIDRTEITAGVVDQADLLLAFRLDHATIAKRLGLTEYVVGVMAADRLRNGRRQPPDLHARHVRNRRKAVDVSIICMIQRMLAIGFLNHRQIAREVGVSMSVVTQIANGERTAVSTLRAVLSDGERFVPESVRCGECGRKVYVLPCRACRALIQEHLQKPSSFM